MNAIIPSTDGLMSSDADHVRCGLCSMHSRVGRASRCLDRVRKKNHVTVNETSRRASSSFERAATDHHAGAMAMLNLTSFRCASWVASTIRIEGLVGPPGPTSPLIWQPARAKLPGNNRFSMRVLGPSNDPH